MKLKEWLSENHISQKQFADALCVSNVTVNRWINGQRTPSVKIEDISKSDVKLRDWVNG
jgi:transcriptional regulator with XRE-family HTH domain